MPIDLTGKFFEVIQPEVKPGQGLNLGFTVANTSGEDAAPFSIDLYISKDENFSSQDNVKFKLGTYDIDDGLEAGSDTGVKNYRYNTPTADNPFWADGDGTYYVGMVVDSKNQVEELFELNNSSQGLGKDYASLDFKSSFPPSDLTAKSFDIVQEQIKAGQELNLSFAVANNSDQYANPFSFDLYLSKDGDISAEDDLKLSTYDIRGGLAAGTDTGIKTYKYTTPDGSDPFWADDGDTTYHVGMIIDPKNEVTETDETNNSNQGVTLDSDSFDAPTFLPSDLKGSQFDIAQQEIKTGETLDLSFTIAQESENDANPFSADLYISQDANISAEDDMRLGGYDIRNGIAAGGDTGEKTYRYTTPAANDQFWEGGSGTYYVGMLVDPEDEVTESDQTNNDNVAAGLDFNSVEITTLPPADLTGELILTPETLVAGETFDFGFTAANKGGVDSEDFQVDLYVSQDDHISAENDFKIGTYGINDIEAGSDTGILSSPYALPGSGDEFWANGNGTYYLGVVIDGEEQVVESNELNNSNQGLGKDYKAVDIDVIDDLTDLKTNGFQVEPAKISTGDTFEVTYEIYNAGNGSADHFAAGFYIFTEDYLTNNNKLSINDVPEVYYLQGDRNSALINLDPFSGTGQVTTTLTMPTDWEGFTGSGDYYIGLAADPFGDVQELNELNNSLTGEFVDYQKVSIDVV